jgi:hypothetical protein
MGNVFPAKFAKLISLQPIRIILLILHGGVIPLFADRACQINDLSHLNSPTLSCDSIKFTPEFP